MIKEIVTNYAKLRIPCEEVKKGEDISHIIQDLKDTLKSVKGYGLSSNQIGYNKNIAYVKVPKLNPKTKKIEYIETVLINPKIIEKKVKIKVMKESCLSFPDLIIDTKRWVFLVVENHNEKLEKDIILAQDLYAITLMHECDHIRGITLLQRKWKKYGK